MGPYRTFGRALRDLLIEHGFVTGTYNSSLKRFKDERLPGMHYETLRKAVAGARKPSPSVMEDVAGALGVNPAETFSDYQLWLARRQFDPHEVGAEAAMANLLDFSQVAKRRARREPSPK